jgi:alkanesulfonate monooxygenase SsuD/methylene tetrahydromethanopterin reductase-like flavin-dependent oxidoreductase (luciferase family)
MTTLDVQLSPAWCTWQELRDASLEAERMRFGALWVFDHLAGVALGGEAMLECFTLLGALAEATSTIELGSLVANVWNRGVGTAVSAAASVALVSGRPFHFGIGAGTSPRSPWATEQHAVGAELEPRIEDRHARVEALVDLARRAWRPDRPAELSTFPLPSPAPSIVIGVNSDRLATLAGRIADGVNVPWHHPRRDELLAAADRSAVASGRSIHRTVWAYYEPELLDPEHPERLAMDALGLARVVLVQLRAPDFSRSGRLG